MTFEQEIQSTTREIAGGLPQFFPVSSKSNNYKLLEPLGEELARTDHYTDVLKAALTAQDTGILDVTIPKGQTVTIEDDEVFQYAAVTIEGTLVVNGELLAGDIIQNEGTLISNGRVIVDEDLIIESLAELGKLVDTLPREAENLDHYRARLIANYVITTADGTINDVLQSVAEVFNTEVTRVTINEDFGAGGEMSIGVPGDALDAVAFTEPEAEEIIKKFIAASYTLTVFKIGTFTYITDSDYAVSDHDPALGYDGLDANGDPKDTGGTYSGVIQ